MNLNDSPDPLGAALRLDLAGPGITLDLAAGTVSIASDRLRDGIELKLTTVGSDARPLGSFRVTIQSVPLAPQALTSPALVGSGMIGEPVTVDPGSWADADALRLEWCRDGAVIEGAAEASYTPVAADDRTALTCRVTASNVAGETSAETAALAVCYPAPVATGLADLELLLDGDGSVAAGGAFTGAGLSFAVSGAGATIDAATGIVSIPTDALLEATEVTVTATNSGGSASVSFKASVKGVAPAGTTAPKLSGTGKIGAEVSLDAGVWAGKPAPTIARQWLRDGSVIAGATGTSYTPVAADDRAALTCRVTASNAAGSQSATTTAVQVSWPAPVASGTLPDLELTQGAAAGSVAASAAFTGAGLSFAVSGAGATIAAATGVASIPTSALLAAATITVTATNSGGSASTSFKVTVKAQTSGTTVSTRQALLNAIIASADGDVIKIAPGVYDRFVWPKNTSHRLTLMPSQVSNPPIMRGIWITSGSDPYFPAQAARGDWARNLTIDGLRFQAEILTSVQPRTGSPISILGDDGRGYGWRADFSYAGVTNLGEDSGFVGLKIGGGCSDILVQNCLFEQYAKAINTSGATRLTVQQCEFSEICEDGVIIWGGTDLTFRYNIWTKSRGVSLQAAQAYGWDNAEPVHQDFFQIACNAASQYCDGLTISNNVMYDNTFRVHGVLLNNAYVGGSEAANVQGSRHRNVTIENNILFVTHTSAINMTNVYNLTCRRNKVVRSMTGNTGPNDVAMLVGKWGDPTSGNNMANVTIANNVCRKYVGIAPHQDEADWTVSGNVESNAETVMPTGWVEIRPELVTTGRKAGRYGAA